MKRLPQAIETSRFLRIALVFATSILVAGYFFGTALRHPGAVFYADNGDGIKNYYTPIWYVEHDSGATFGGMNYPFTDNIIYFDNQPLISYSLKQLSQYINVTPKEVIALLNLLPVFSLIFCCMLVYYLLRRSNLPFWYALFFAVIINFHAPQVARLLGSHYSLSYTCFVPLVWICLDQILCGKHAWVLGICLTFILLAFVFIHLYYLPIAFFMAIIYGAVHLLQKRRLLSINYTRYVVLLFAIVIPVVVFRLWLSGYDHYTDRVVIPFGLEFYHSGFYSLFLPSYLPHPDIPLYNFEGQAYVGWFGLIMLVLILFKYTSYLLRQKFNWMITPIAPSILQTVPLVCLMFFFLSNASIFLWLSKLFPSAFEGLHQFRSVGRFAWVFYYMFSCWSVWIMFLLIRKLRMKGLDKIATYAMVVVCGLSAYETWYFLQPVKDQLESSYNTYEAYNFLATKDNYNDWLTSAGYNSHDFQAIVPIPFFNSGSEKVGYVIEESTALEAMKASLSTGLPITTALTARESVGITEKVMQLLSGPYIRKSILQNYPSLTRPLLVIYNRKKRTQDDSLLLSYGKCIFSNNNVMLYSLQLSLIDSIYFRSMANVRVQINSGQLAAPIIYDDFDKAKHNRVAVDGAFATNADNSFFASWILPDTLTEDTMIFSCWVKILPRYNGMPELRYHLKGSNNNSTTVTNPTYSQDIFENWVIMQDTITNAQGRDTIFFSVTGKEIALDNFQVRYKHQASWVKDASGSFAGYYNGYPIPRE